MLFCLEKEKWMRWFYFCNDLKVLDVANEPIFVSSYSYIIPILRWWYYLNITSIQSWMMDKLQNIICHIYISTKQLTLYSESIKVPQPVLLEV